MNGLKKGGYVKDDKWHGLDDHPKRDATDEEIFDDLEHKLIVARFDIQNPGGDGVLYDDYKKYLILAKKLVLPNRVAEISKSRLPSELSQ